MGPFDRDREGVTNGDSGLHRRHVGSTQKTFLYMLLQVGSQGLHGSVTIEVCVVIKTDLKEYYIQVEGQKHTSSTRWTILRLL